VVADVIQMRYRLRTLLLALALGPPAIGFAMLLAPSHSLLAALAVGWPVAFFGSVT
jgi:hypothetical protein